MMVMRMIIFFLVCFVPAVWFVYFVTRRPFNNNNHIISAVQHTQKSKLLLTCLFDMSILQCTFSPITHSPFFTRKFTKRDKTWNASLHRISSFLFDSCLTYMFFSIPFSDNAILRKKPATRCDIMMNDTFHTAKS